MDTVKELLQQFKIPLIIGGAAIVLFIVLGKVVPIIQDANANKTPIAEIVAENDKTYKNTEELSVEDFKVTAIHEDGAKTKLSSDFIELSKTTLNQVGATTTVTLTYTEDSSIYCNVDVNVEREKIMGFQCGYPNVTNVIAVLYSNGELCFEGEGDTLTFTEGDYPWNNYDKKDNYPIKAITFQKTVQPRVMDYWFENIETLTYVDAIPDTVQSMKRTFSNCINLSTMADWTKCSSLLDITECYKDCVNLKYTVALPDKITKATSAFEGCVLLQKTPNLANATSLRQSNMMFRGCSKLVSITMPPNLKIMESMFEDCINLQIMPSIPESVTNMNTAFRGCTALSTLSTIPSNVETMSSCFENCEFIEGTATINANPIEMGNAFQGACVATTLDLNGSSVILDAFANSNNYGNITVNGQKPIETIRSYSDYEQYLEELEREKEREREEALRAQQEQN